MREVCRTVNTRRLTIAMVMLATLPVIASAVRAFSIGWVPVGDDAVIAVRAYDVLTTRSPLVGQYSAASVLLGEPTYSPGPMLYWLLAVPARLGSGALLLTITAVNVTAATAAVLLARRMGGAALMVGTAVGIALMSQSLDPRVWSAIWNPSAALLPFTLLIFLTLWIACGGRRLLPAAVLIASFVMQAHVAYAVPTVGLLLVAISGLLLTQSRHRIPGLRRWIAASLLVGIACWSAPLVEQLAHSPGNLAKIARASQAPESTLGLQAGWNELSHAIGVRPHWLREARDPHERVTDTARSPALLRATSSVLILLALVALLAVSVRRRSPAVVAATTQALALCVAVVLVTQSLPAESPVAITASYALWWSSITGMFVWLVLAYALWQTLRLSQRLPRRALVFVSTALVVSGSTLGVWAVATASSRPEVLRSRYEPARELGTDVAGPIASGDTVRIEREGEFTFARFDFETALAYALRRRGADVRARSLVPPLPEAYRGTDVEGHWVVHVGDPTPSGRVIARIRVPDPPETVVVSLEGE